MAGIYLHIPFCRQACHYCDFHFSTQLDNKQAMVNAIRAELTIQQHYLDKEIIDTVYFGGGTPSLLTEEDLDLLLGTIRQLFSVSPDAEITLEANPDDLTREALRSLKSVGINRLSIGIQSFDDNLLRYLHRVHTAQTSVHCIAHAREAGFKNISIDLIYAIPGLTHDLWRQEIQRALMLAPKHISAYALTIEEKTVFGRWAEKGKLALVDEETAATQLEILIDTLSGADYEHYEVSNFALPEFRSRHNSSYWQRKKYLGVGPSAHSYNGDSRQFNVSNNTQYIRAIQDGKIPATLEVLSQEDNINDYLMTSLRTNWGIDLVFLRDQLNYPLMSVHAPYVNSLVERKLATLENGYLRLTTSGKLLADKISSDLFAIV